MQNDKFKLRRDELLKQIGAGSIAVVHAAKECIRSDSEYYPYRQNSNFYYLTGFTEPESIAVFAPGRSKGEFILFSRKRDVTKELWHGPCAGQEGACRDFGADQAFSIEEADVLLPQLLVDRKSIDISEILHEMRLKKESYELELMRMAAEITAAGHLRAMQTCRPGMHEFELESELLYEFTRLGGRDKAFQTIVGGGANACTLHYSKNADRLIDGDLVLVDAGVEYKYYCADVTRTFPVNGKFTPKQRAIYEAVLTTQLEVINQIRPGIRFNSLQLLAERVITEHLVSLGLLKGKVGDLVAEQSFKPFFMHKIGHWLGLDVHDVGKYQTDDAWRVLEPGMVFTVEPGIYIAPDIGVRVEDNILVTENGCDVLTKMIPKTIEEIEATMKDFKKHF
ncbi:MAG: aminopeptidase P N-terminal domain-containing protein [bacterium]